MPSGVYPRKGGKPKVSSPLSDSELRDLFEWEACDWYDLEEVLSLRMENGSYSEPKIASAWRWYKRGYRHSGA